MPRAYKLELQFPFPASDRIAELFTAGTQAPNPPETRNLRHNGLRRIQVRRTEHHPQIPKQTSWVTAAIVGILRFQGGSSVKKTATEPKGAGPKGVAGKG